MESVGAVRSAVSANDLSDACRMWQGGRNVGSSLLRAAARRVTGVPHYFSAPYIDGYDVEAAGRPDAQAAARILLDSIEQRPWTSIEDLAHEVGWAGEAVAERGIESRATFEEDEQIARLVTAPGAVISMPLWGFSMDRDVARSYGERFVFRLTGPMVGIPAWVHSGIKAEEAEVIASGTYAVEQIIDESGTTVVELRQIDRIAILDHGDPGRADSRISTPTNKVPRAERLRRQREEFLRWARTADSDEPPADLGQAPSDRLPDE